MCSRTNVLSHTSPFSAIYYTAYECSKFFTHCTSYTSHYYTAYASADGNTFTRADGNNYKRPFPASHGTAHDGA